MDRRLVFARTRRGRGQALLHTSESARRPRGGKLRLVPARCQDSAQGPEGRLALVRAELLPPLPACGAARAAGGYIDQSCRLSLRDANGRTVTAMAEELTGKLSDVS